MNKSAGENFCEIVKHILFCEQNLESYKMAPKKIQKAFNQLDFARRGELNVSDFFKGFPELSQEDLFHIFKALDISRTGSITLQDMIEVLGCSDPLMDSSERDPSSALKFCIKIMQLNYQGIEKKKKELKLDRQNLKAIFEEILVLAKSSKSIASENLIEYLKTQRMQLSSFDTKYIKQFLFGPEEMNIKEFIDYFLPFSWSEIPKLQEVLQKGEQIQQDNRDLKVQDLPKTDIKHFYLYSPPASPSYLSKYMTYDQQNPGLKKVLSDDNILNRFAQKSSPSQTWNSSMKNNWVEEKDPKQEDRQFFEKNIQEREKWKCQMNESVNNTLSYIERRREQLKKGSLERQKIVESIMKKNQKSAINYGKNYNINQERPSTNYNTAQNFYQKPAEYNPREFYERYNKTPRLSNEFSSKEVPIRNQFTSKYSEMMNALNNTNNQNGHDEWRARLSHEKRQYFRENSFQKSPDYHRPQYAPQPNKVDLAKFSNEAINSSAKINGYSRVDMSKYFQRSPENSNYSRTASTAFNYNKTIDKENILRRAEEEAARKIEQIQRKARMKVMEKRSNLGVHNYWMK